MIIQNFDLNLIPDTAPVVVHCDQYDRGTGRLVVSLYIDAISYSPSGTAIIQGVKPDGRGFMYNATMSGNVVTADLTEQMTAVAGRVRCQIVVTEASGRTGTFVFELDVQKSALPADTDMSESDYQLIEQAIEDAQQAVTDAQNSAEDAEAWAVGERGGVPVPTSDDTYHNNAKYWAELASQYAQGGLHYKGSCLFANIPVSGMTDGDMWNIEDDFTTDSRFREGSGKSVAAGTNIAWIADTSKWDVLAVPQTIPDMTLATKGIGKPDGITTDVSSGTFSAKGVGIVADVNSSGTVHGADWLYYTGTTTVIVPNASQMYRVTISGTASLWYWDGTQYVQLASSGGGGGGASLVDVTTAQYNALTPAEKADPDVWYWINDMDGMSGTAIVIGTFAGLTDVNFTNLQDGQIPVYNATIQKWENQDITIPSGDYYELVDGTSIAAGTDLNNLTTVGTYTKRAQSFKATNEPSDLTQYERYNLIVQMADNTKTVTTGSPLMQILYAHTRNTGEIKVYTRGYTVPVGWSAWQSIGSGGSSGGDYVGLYGMTEIQSSDGQGTTEIDLDTYTSVGNYYCNGKGKIQPRYYFYDNAQAGLQSTIYTDAVFILVVKKLPNNNLTQELTICKDTEHLSGYFRLIRYKGIGGWTYWSRQGSGTAYGIYLTVNQIYDTSLSSLATGDVLVYNNTNLKWQNKPLSGYITNPNLIDNPWFTINQRGQSSYGGGVYGYDRWLSANGSSVTSDTNGIKLIGTVWQRFEPDFITKISGKTVTLSVLLGDGTVYSASGIAQNENATFITIDNDDIVARFMKDTYYTFIHVQAKDSAGLVIRAVKLELGSISTLALDTAPNYATELLKCQRHFQRIGKLSTSGYGKTITTGPAFSSSTIWMPFELSVPMRTHPAITITGRFLVTPSGAGQKVSDTEHTLVISAPNFSETDTELLNIALDDSSNPFTIGGWYKFATYVAAEVATIDLIADL